MLSTYPSRSGSLSASFGGKQLHSSFDPVREAERFVERELAEIPRTVIVVGPGLGHLIRAIDARRPDCAIISLFLSAECHRNAVATGSHAWHPEAGMSPAEFLESTLDELDGASVAVLEWGPASACFSSEAHQVRSAISDVLNRRHASLMTEGANGRRWFSNLLRNFVALDHPVGPQPDGGSPVSACVLAVSGPSLEESLEIIEGFRSDISLWVVGSALDAVLVRGYTPDLVISTDAAVFASEYVRSAATNPKRSYPIAAPLTASRGIADSPPVWCLQQGDPFEHLIYSELVSQPTAVAAHGTVTGTALQLALAIQPWPVIVAGMDFAWRDLTSHARPHVAEIYRDVAGFRLSPAFSSSYRRSREMSVVSGRWLTNPSMQVYSRWFGQAARGLAGRVYRIANSPANDTVPVMPPGDVKALPRSFSGMSYSPIPWPDRRRRARIVAGARDRCVSVLAPLTAAANDLKPDAIQASVLRRLALDGLLRWHRNGNPADLATAARDATDTLMGFGGPWE